MKQSKMIEVLKSKFPDINLVPGDNHYWSPKERNVYFKRDDSTLESTWSLLHETGHALLNHIHYFTDIELLTMEMDAWEKAKNLATELDIEIDDDHIQDCLDSYRDWLHKRSLCPDCFLSGIQINTSTYSCIFCHKKWKVSSERFCRPYRRKTLYK